MSPVEEALANKFLPKLLGLQSISGRLRKLLALGYKRSGLSIPDPMEGGRRKPPDVAGVQQTLGGFPLQERGHIDNLK